MRVLPRSTGLGALGGAPASCAKRRRQRGYTPADLLVRVVIGSAVVHRVADQLTEQHVGLFAGEPSTVTWPRR